MKLPPEGIEDAEAVMVHGDIKHPGEEWKTISKEEHLEHAIHHITEYVEGNRIDHESGKSPLAHAICRLDMILALERQEGESCRA